MKLRNRFSLYFALGTGALIVVSRVVTLASFQRLQQNDLDRGLRARAEEEGNAVALVGRKALETDHDVKAGEGEEAPDPLEQLVTYGALYRADGSVVADTPSFLHAPAFHQLGLGAVPGPRDCFDFRFRGGALRGVMVEVKGASEKQFLLLAASRRDMDADARQLLEVGWWVFAASLPISLAMGWWLGRRATRRITGLAASARRVARGDLDVRFAASGPQDEEVEALADALREMVSRTKTLVETERRFASHAAHELRSPLAVLRGELELALRRPRKGSEYEAFLRDALEDTKRLTDLAEDLLVVARSGGGMQRPEDALSTRELVEEAIAGSRARSADAPRVYVEGEGASVRGVRADLVRMLRNLVDNAIEHGDGESPVRVVLREVDDHEAGIVVENQGPGITDEDRDRIFEHFHRGADARAISGAGLGLGIAREVALRHGGLLVLERPANPTRFVVRLPARATQRLA